jgi:sucrose-6-phosphate hydrolase SacC (GH32 family)
LDDVQNGKKKTRHTIHFLTSPNLKDWKVTSEVDGFFECPDFFPLAIDGNAQNTKWVLAAANSDYAIGTFDGERFISESGILKGHRGKGFYAAQTYSDIPAADGRRIQIGWLQAPSPGMPFNQCMSLPLELKLVSTAEGPRLTWSPVRELESLRTKVHRAGPLTVRPGDSNPLGPANGELLEVNAEFEPEPGAQVKFVVRGVPIAFDAGKEEVSVNGHRARAPLAGGRQRLRLFADRTAFEVFASGGQTYVPMPVIADPHALGVEVSVSGGAVTFSKLEVARLRSIWN